eukprot:1146403-Pelagomonas_calceolata.AAC.3
MAQGGLVTATYVEAEHVSVTNGWALLQHLLLLCPAFLTMTAEGGGDFNTTREGMPAGYECKGCLRRMNVGDACSMNIGETSTRPERECLPRMNVRDACSV